jgi:dynactin-4
LQKNEDSLPDAKEFDQLKEHFEKHLRVNAPPSLPTSFLSFSGSSALSKYMGTHFHHDTQMQQGKLDDINEYKPSVQVPDDDVKLLETMTTLRNVDGGLFRMSNRKKATKLCL